MRYGEPRAAAAAAPRSAPGLPAARAPASAARRRALAALAAFPPALAAFAAPARADAVIDEAARVIARHHLMRSDPASLPRDTRAGLLASLRRVDPAAQWWQPNVAAANRAWTGEGVSGIGVSVVEDGDRVLFVPLPGGALARHGFGRPVRLLALAGQAVERLGSDGVQRILGDPAHDPVQVRIEGLEGGPPAALALRRAPYTAASVERIEVYGAPVLRVHRFVKGLTLRQFRHALQPIVAAGRPVVLDLRYCTGGDLFEALDTASLFLPPGVPLATLEDGAGRRVAFRSVGDGAVRAGRVAVLVGAATVSASEVVAAVLREQAGARLIGRPTFGKCLAQSAFPLTDGSVLLISTGRVLTGRGPSCDGRGLDPDILVDRAEADDTAALLARVGP